MGEPVRLEISYGLGQIIIDEPPVNALSHVVRQGLMNTLDAALKDTAIKGIVLSCRGKTFIAGADIREFGQPPRAPLLPDVIARLEASPKPIVAVLHGTVLGGGLEVALACHARIAAAQTRFGLPEVTLGIIPGAGGTQRLPRLIGLMPALDMISTGRLIQASEALKLGLIDQMSDNLTAEALALARSLIGQAIRRSGALPLAPFDSLALAQAIEQISRKARGQIAPLRAAEAVQCASLPLDAGLARERALFLELVDSNQSKALRYAFFAEREVLKVPKLAGVQPRSLAHIGIVGGGTMGAGIAVACLDGGYAVTLVETSPATAQAGRERILATYNRLQTSGRMTQAETTERLAKLSLATDYVALAQADLVIEAAFEDMTVKQEIFTKLAASTQQGTVLASNTSYLDIDQIAVQTERAADTIGLHFFSPAHIMRLVEVIEAKNSDPEALATGIALVRSLGKIPVLSGICDGFIGNRLWSQYRRVAEAALEDGALPHEIDAAMEAYGFAMGPFAVNDLAGLDIGLAQRRRRDHLRSPFERYAATLADDLCALGRFGQKTGHGFYLYESGKRQIDPEVAVLAERISAQKHILRRPISSETLQANVRAALVNEGARILSEGIAARALDIDIALLHGYGFPRWRGGPLFEADALGLETILHDVKALHSQLGYGFEPAPLLQALATKGRSFASLAPNEGQTLADIAIAPAS